MFAAPHDGELWELGNPDVVGEDVVPVTRAINLEILGVAARVLHKSGARVFLRANQSGFSTGGRNATPTQRSEPCVRRTATRYPQLAHLQCTSTRRTFASGLRRPLTAGRRARVGGTRHARAHRRHCAPYRSTIVRVRQPANRIKPPSVLPLDNQLCENVWRSWCG
jgi:hypothetical protein